MKNELYWVLFTVLTIILIPLACIYSGAKWLITTVRAS